MATEQYMEQGQQGFELEAVERLDEGQDQLPAPLKQELEVLLGNPEAMTSVLRRYQEFQAPALAWIEAKGGVHARSQVEPQLHATVEQNYQVRAGDSLSLIAKRELGDVSLWQKLYEKNKDSIGENPNNLKVGTVLRIPNDLLASSSQHLPTSTAIVTPEVEVETLPPVEEQFSQFAEQVGNSAKAAQQVAASPAPAAPSGERFEQRENGPGDRLLYSHSDPLLGQFDLVLGLDGDISTQVQSGSFKISSGGGLLFRTPKGMSDILVHELAIDLKTMDVEIDSEPEIGPLETEMLKGVLKQTLASQAPELLEEGKSPIAKAMEGLEEKDGERVVWGLDLPLAGSVAEVLVSPDVAAGVHFDNEGLDFSINPGLHLSIPGPDIRLSKLRYDFASASFSIEQEAADGKLGAVANFLRQPLLDGVAWAGSKLFQRYLPPAMRVEGYDPTKDPNIEENINTLIANVTGVVMGDGAEAASQAQPETAASGGAAPAPKAKEKPENAQSAQGQSTDSVQAQTGPQTGEELDYTQLYALNTEGMGKVEVCMDKEDAFSIYKDADAVGFDTENGIFLKVPGQEWLSNIRIKGVRYGVEDGRLDIDGSERLGEFARSVLEDVVNMYVMPQLPGEVKQGVGVEGQDSETHQVMFADEIDGAGRVEVLLKKEDRLSLTRSSDAIEMSAPQGLIIRAPGIAGLPELAINRISYSLKDGEIVIDAQDDIGPIVEVAVSKVMRNVVVPSLPGVAQDIGLVKGGGEGEQVPAPGSTILFEDEMPMVGAFDVSINEESNLQVSGSASEFSISAQEGLLIRLPSAGLAVRIFGVSLQRDSGEVDIQASEELGAYERKLISSMFQVHGQPLIDKYLGETDNEGDQAHDILYTYSSPELGNVSVCVPKGGSFQVEKTDTAIILSSAEGISLLGDLPIPDFKLHRVEYQLGTGKFDIDVGGIHQGAYVENESVGPMTEELVASAVKALVAPHLPPEAQNLGIVGFGEDDEYETPVGTKVFEQEVPSLGAISVLLQKGDILSVTANEHDLSVLASKGLIIDIPSLRQSINISSIFYHVETGEIQVNGLGAFENAVIEEAMMEFISPMLPAAMQGGGAPLDALLKGRQSDRKGRKQLYESDMVDIYMKPGTRFDIDLYGGGLKFVSKPGLLIDSVAFFNYNFNTLVFDFDTQRFRIDVSGDNGVAGLLDSTIRKKAEKALNEKLIPLMPPEMLAPDYDLYSDSKLSERVMVLMQNFSAMAAAG